jgi:cytochrome c biogenesis protein CcdA/thiol-disulfide isomerase/thioredoxin
MTMLLIVLAYLGGVLTILSPCILPVLPFVFARVDQPFVRSGLPLLAGMTVAFASVATLATLGGGWAVQANEYGRWVAMALLGVFGLTLMVPRIADRLMAPLVRAGNRLSDMANRDGKPAGARSSFLLGIATGLLWTPCAGPILGIVLTSGALHGANVGTTLLLVAYAAGAATSLAVALVVGGNLFAALKRQLGAGEWLRRALGGAVVLGVAAISFGWDTGVLSNVSSVATGGIEQKLVNWLSPAKRPAGGVAVEASNASEGTNTSSAHVDGGFMNASYSSTSNDAPALIRVADSSAGQDVASLPVEGTMPPLDGAVQWLNSPPLTAEGLRGKVVLINIWTYSCINCLRSLPYIKAWAQKYKDQGLVVIGVHDPEFAFEHNVDNVKRATHDLGVTFPVAIDNNFAIWKALGNEYWPAQYFIDAQGRIRHHNFGEGDYANSEKVIQELLKEAGDTRAQHVALGLANVATPGTQMAADGSDLGSPETYVGYAQATNFVSPGGEVQDEAHSYVAPTQPELNTWGLAGDWNVSKERATLVTAHGRIIYRFHARDLHLVLGPAKDGKPVRFRVSIDGAAPGAAHGADVAADGSGTVTEYRLYQLVRQTGSVTDHTFTIEFLDPGVQAYDFTFG